MLITLKSRNVKNMSFVLIRSWNGIYESYNYFFLRYFLRRKKIRVGKIFDAFSMKLHSGNLNVFHVTES